MLLDDTGSFWAFMKKLKPEILFQKSLKATMRAEGTMRGNPTQDLRYELILVTLKLELKGGQISARNFLEEMYTYVRREF